MAVKATNLILTDKQIDQKIKRIAYEIYEQNFKEKSIFLAGIVPSGLELAKKLVMKIEEISPLDVNLVQVKINKKDPSRGEIEIDRKISDLKDKVVILVDDVLNTGKTFAYSMRPFLSVQVKKIEVAVLVNRSHTNFPILSNYTGYEISTTINEHINVMLSGKDKGVYLI